MLTGPQRGDARGLVEILSLLQACDHPIVVAADVQLASLDRTHGVEDLIGLGAVSDKVAKANDAIEFLSPHARQHGAQGFGVRVKIADHENLHQVLRTTFFAESRKPFGNSSSRRSTISAGVSSSRISSVTSDIR